MIATPPILAVRDLRAYYQMRYFGVVREGRAVDDITLEIRRDEIYGLAGESSSGKTSFIKTIVAANRPPLNVVGGSVEYSTATFTSSTRPLSLRCAGSISPTSCRAR